MPPVKKPKTKPVDVPAKEETNPVVSGQLQKKIQRQQGRQKLKRGVVFIKHLPHGFFEDQLRNYFEQFGTVTRLRLARSKYTGGTKGYAYIEFEYPEVAEVAAETMDNYLMFNKVVKASYIPPEKQAYNFFKSSVRQVKNKAGKAIYVSGKTASISRRVKKFNETSEDDYQKRTAEKLKKIEKLNKKYAHLGIDFSKIVVGSKKIDESAAKEDNSEAVENEESQIKGGKRKTKNVDKTAKKSKKALELEDLLGETLNEESDDEDYVPTSDGDEEHNEENASKSIHLEDLLGETLNDDSDDDEWDLADVDENAESDEEELSATDDDENAEEEEQNTPKALKVTQKKGTQKTKGKKSKEDQLEKLIKHKKHTGGVQKTNKVLSKRPKFGKAKNTMQAALAKELAQPMPSLKNKVKLPKKQKK